MYLRSNSLKGTYNRYQQHQVKSLVNKIPNERKEALLEEIKARVCLLGVSNSSALKSALKHLEPKKPKKEKGSKNKQPK